MTHDEAVQIYETIRDTWRYSNQRCQRKLSNLIDDLDDGELRTQIVYLRQAITTTSRWTARMNLNQGHQRNSQ